MTTPLASIEPEPRPLGWVWIYCPRSLLGARLENSLADKAYVHRAAYPPAKEPSSIVFCPSGPVDDAVKGLRRLQAVAPEVPIVVFGSSADLPLARVALREGARGFVHVGMPPEQISRALLVVAQKGEMVVPRELLKEMVAQEPRMDVRALTHRQLEILKLVAQGLSNAQIARRLWLSEYTIKQHLRRAYKALGVKNRIQAAALFRRDEPVGALGDVSGSGRGCLRV